MPGRGLGLQLKALGPAPVRPNVRRHQAQMRSKITIFVIALALTGCSSVEPATRGTWRASIANGDKVGIGIELTRTSHGVRGFMYLLDPNKPHDFAAGSRRRMEIHEFTDREIRFAVQWLPTLRAEKVLRLAAPLIGSSVRGEMQSADGQDEAQVYEFTRTR